MLVNCMPCITRLVGEGMSSRFLDNFNSAVSGVDVCCLNTPYQQSFLVLGDIMLTMLHRLFRLLAVRSARVCLVYDIP